MFRVSHPGFTPPPLPTHVLNLHRKPPISISCNLRFASPNPFGLPPTPTSSRLLLDVPLCSGPRCASPSRQITSHNDTAAHAPPRNSRRIMHSSSVRCSCVYAHVSTPGRYSICLRFCAPCSPLHPHTVLAPAPRLFIPPVFVSRPRCCDI